jgi:hypothetical protein
MVGSASGSGTEIMSSNGFSPIQTLGFGLKQILPKKDPLSYLLRTFGPPGWLQRTKTPVTFGKELGDRKLKRPVQGEPVQYDLANGSAQARQSDTARPREARIQMGRTVLARWPRLLAQ